MRPKITIESRESIDAMYDYYEDHQQSQIFARLAHVVLGKIYRPIITFEAGAEDAIGEAIENKTRLNISPNHLTDQDQNVIVAMAQREPVFHPLRGRTHIPAKQSIFNRPLKKGGPILRRAVDGLGAIPVYRMEDLKRLGLDQDDEAVENYEYAMQRVHEVQNVRLVRGVRNHGRPTRYPTPAPSNLPYDHWASFWEGTRNLTDHTTVQSLKLGPAYTACEAAQDVDVAVVPMAFYYGGEPTDYKKQDVPLKHTPNLHIGMPIPVETYDPKELIQLVHSAIQACADVAVAASLARAA